MPKLFLGPVLKSRRVLLALLLPILALAYFGYQHHQVRALAAGHQEPRAVAQVPGFTTVDVSGATTTSLSGTIVVGVDAAGDVGGIWTGTKAVRHGFFRTAAGVTTSFDAPGAGTNANQYDSGQGTIPVSMDAAGDMAGYYIDASNSKHGFFRTAAGAITSFDVPNAPNSSSSGTVVTGINASGTVTGYYNFYSNPSLNNYVYTYYSFVRTANGTITTFGAPGAALNYYAGTRAMAINSAGQITGTYIDSNGLHHGFLRSADGTTITSFDAPSSAFSATQNSRVAEGTIPLGINTAGFISGAFSDQANLTHGFIRSPDGSFTVLNTPNAATSSSALMNIGQIISGTGAVTINDSQVVAGVYMDANSLAHGFTSTLTRAYTVIDDPSAGTGGGGYQGTAGMAINSAGTVAGTYLDSSSVLHGFIYTAAPAVTVTANSSITTLQPLSVTVTVAGTPAPSGSVILSGGGYTSAATNLTSGSATISIPAGSLATGSDTLTATYTPDSASTPLYRAATGTAGVSVTVGKTATTLTLAANPTSSSYTQQIALTATLTPYTGTAGNTNTELVTFYNGSTNLGTAALTSGVATLNVTSLPVGTASLTASYPGDTNFVASTTATAVSLPVTTNFTVPATSIGTQTVSVGGTATYTFSVSPSGGATFLSPVTFSATGLPTGATATFTPNSITAGSGTTSVTMNVQIPNVARLERMARPGENLPVIALGLLLLPFAGKVRRSGKRLGKLTALMLVLMMAGTIAMISGCSSGGGSNAGTTTSIKGNYTITVTATSGGVSHTSTAALTVQ